MATNPELTGPGPLVRIGAILAQRRRALAALAIAAVALLAMFALRELLHTVHYRDLRVAVRVLPRERLALAGLFTAASYLALTGYDWFALRAVGHPMPWRKAALASFVSYALSNNLGFAVFTGGSARMRIYSSEGLEPGAIAGVIAIASLTFWSGVALLAGAGLLAGLGGAVPLPLPVAPGWQGALGLALVLAGLAPILVRLASRQRVRIGSWILPMPTVPQSLGLLSVALVDLAAASAALLVLAPGIAPALWPGLFVAYALAVIATLVSHVPGGLGVFEAVILLAFPGNRAELLAALLVYRLIYYLVPLFLAAIVLLLHERRAIAGSWLASLGAATRFSTHSIAPPALGALVFAGGVVLLLSGATPPLHGRMAELSRTLPLPFIETSHVMASLAGTMLLFVAQGLWRRLDGAFHLARTTLVAGAVFSLAKGLDFEEAMVCLVIAALLQASQGAFYRRSTLTAAPLSTAWTVAALAALGGSVLVGFFAYQNVPYTNDLWLRFVVRGGAAPRFLRASLAAGLLVVGFGWWRLLRPAADEATGDPFDEAKFTAALEHAHCADAFLALTGDKRVLYAPEGDAFVMFAVQGSSWVMLGDPIGEPERWGSLLWRLREAADEAQASLLLYQISEASLPHAIDMGLSVSKYGEEALVPLDRFTMTGSAFRSLRHSHKRASGEGAVFALLSPAETVAAMDELRGVSDQWLAAKAREEKSFSLGRFDPAYLARFPTAVARKDGRIVAFANVMALPNRQELSVDLMRHADAMPYGTMDFLFVELMQWGRAQGYKRFNLGIAPLAGLPRHRLAPLLGRAGALLFRHGERFYGFAGLRSYKAKFSPDWAPIYLAAPSEFAMLRSLVSLYGLISAPFGRGAGGSTPA